MKFILKEMEEKEAVAISLWHYEEPYTFYDLKSDLDNAKEFLDFTQRPKDKYISVNDEFGNLVGFFEFTLNSNAVVMGLGMKPDLTGKGHGLDFVSAGIEFVTARFRPEVIRLLVVSFNRRAQRVYERAGFKHTGEVMIANDLGKNEFLEMELSL